MKLHARIRNGLLLVLALLFMLAIIAVPGCRHKRINPLDFKVLSVNVDRGIELLLITKDKKGNPVVMEGVIGVKLWYRTRLVYEVKTDDTLVQEWSNIPLIAEDYSKDAGASIFLAYDKPHHLQSATGIIQVTLETLDGKTLVYERDCIQISTDIDYTQ